jgi:hypothetical protein
MGQWETPGVTEVSAAYRLVVIAASKERDVGIGESVGAGSTGSTGSSKEILLGPEDRASTRGGGQGSRRQRLHCEGQPSSRARAGGSGGDGDDGGGSNGNGDGDGDGDGGDDDATHDPEGSTVARREEVTSCVTAVGAEKFARSVREGMLTHGRDDRKVDDGYGIGGEWQDKKGGDESDGDGDAAGGDDSADGVAPEVRGNESPTF